MKGKLIVIEGTDCSGKETQSKMLIEKLKQDGYPVEKFSFPMYDTPTGKIVGGPYLGKSYICDGWFKEGADKVDPKVAALYCAADRRYNMDKIVSLLNTGVHVILDRYTYSNMAHQGGKIKDIREHLHMETNEFNPYRKRLIKKGILSGETRGYVYFTLPLFEEYVMENY